MGTDPLGSIGGFDGNGIGWIWLAWPWVGLVGGRRGYVLRLAALQVWPSRWCRERMEEKAKKRPKKSEKKEKKSGEVTEKCIIFVLRRLCGRRGARQPANQRRM